MMHDFWIFLAGAAFGFVIAAGVIVWILHDADIG